MVSPSPRLPEAHERMVFFAFLESIFSFLPAFAMNRLLAYLENPAAATFTPYVWVALLLLIPVTNSMIMQCYFVRSIQLTANAKAALVQALYEKTLRIRMVGAPKGEEDVERNRMGRINNLMSSDMYSLPPSDLTVVMQSLEIEMFSSS